MLIKEKKETIIKDYSQHEKDTGSTQVQIALLTVRINELNEHFKANPKDFGSSRGLKILVGRRSRLLKYLKRSGLQEYNDFIQRVGLRK